MKSSCLCFFIPVGDIFKPQQLFAVLFLAQNNDLKKIKYFFKSPGTKTIGSFFCFLGTIQKKFGAEFLNNF